MTARSSGSPDDPLQNGRNGTERIIAIEVEHLASCVLSTLEARGKLLVVVLGQRGGGVLGGGFRGHLLDRRRTSGGRLLAQAHGRP